MNRHPALSMLLVWGICVAAYVLLPYQLLERQLTLQGGIILAIFIAAFVVGTLLVPTGGRTARRPTLRVDAAQAERLLAVAACLATLFFLLDARDKDLFDLAVAYELRSETADALLKGEASNSSIWFQLAFLLYPAAYVYLAVHAIYAARVNAWSLALVGLLPIVLATVNMGGRVPIFYAVLVTWFALRLRNRAGHPPRQTRPPSPLRKALVWAVWVGIAAVLAYYFAAVFMVRAAVVGGSAEMFSVAEERWGVGFRGPLSGPLFELLGEDATYLLFVFVWYLVQGLVMSNYLFSAYDGPLQLGIYGIDLMSAVMRRIDPQRVAEGFDSLLSLGTYGFLPSAWGSLYVDYAFSGVIACAVWGMFTALAYRRIRREWRTDWLFIGPFVSIGIIFSIINTPLGFTNGFVTHGWLLLSFWLLRRRPAVKPALRLPLAVAAR